ncbi:MAG TPA: transketolase C-terminal domain-containing protein, partial [Lentisphaeria bacterium]|nr:transketolase C-terminal domain-containing protein [Lentisphaeria bacterium]
LQPADQDDLAAMLRLAVTRRHPVVIRYPAGNAAPVTAQHHPLEWGKAETLESGSAPIALWAVGREAAVALQAAELLRTQGIAITVVNARFTIPFDADLMRRQLNDGMTVVTLEDHCVEGGFGSIARDSLADVPDARIVKLGWPRAVLPNGPVAYLRQRFSLTTAGIAETIRGLLARPPASPQSKPPFPA